MALNDAMLQILRRERDQVLADLTAFAADGETARLTFEEHGRRRNRLDALDRMLASHSEIAPLRHTA